MIEVCIGTMALHNLPVYKISSLKITPPKTPNSGKFSYLLPNIVSFLFEKKLTRVPV